MKPSKLQIIVAALFVLIATSLFHLRAADAQSQRPASYEYATIRWAGRENTHVIRPDGNVEFVGAQLDKVIKPNRVDDRAFYMNIVMNGLTKEGYEFAGMSSDDIVMKRSVNH